MNTPPKKIAILCSTGAWGGLEINVFNICKWLHFSGLIIIVFAKLGTKLANELEKIGIKTIEYDQKRRKHFLFGKAKKLARQIDSLNIVDLVIGHYENHYTAVLSTLFSKNTLNIIYLQQMQQNRKKRGIYYGFLFNRINHWIVPLDSLKNQLVQNAKVMESKVHVVPLCLETDKFYLDTTSKQEARFFLNLPLNSFVIGCIGRLDKEKGQETILKAAHTLIHKIPNLLILFIGEETSGGTGYKQYLQNLCDELGIKDNLLFLPFTSRPEIAHRVFDIFIMSSLSEPYGMVTLEALLSTTTVIGTNTGGTPELLNFGKAGNLFSPSDFQQLATFILDEYRQPKPKEVKNSIAKDVFNRYNHLFWCESFIKSLNQ